MMDKNDALIKLLQIKNQIKFFNNLEKNEIILLIKDIIFKKYIKDEIIFNQGENNDDYIYYILKGDAHITIKNKDIIKKVATVYENSIIGEMKPILNVGRTATCKAGLDGALVLGFNIENKCEELNPMAYMKFYKNMAYILAQKIEKTNERIS